MGELHLSQQKEKDILMIILNKISPDVWRIIYAIHSYIEANIGTYKDENTVFKDIEALGIKLEWEKKNDIFLPSPVWNRLRNIARRILSEEWNEFSIITGYELSELSVVFNALAKNSIQNNINLHQLFFILEWCGLQTIKEIQEHILPVFNNGEFGEYKYLFENLEANRTNKEFFQTKLPIELVVKIIDTMGMVLFYRSDENALLSINYEHQKPDEIGVFIRSNGYDAILNYENHDERAIKTSDALIEYGFEIIEKAYERTRVKL